MPDYQLVRYIRVSDTGPPELSGGYWAINYMLPGDLAPRVVFARSATMTDELARKLIEAAIAVESAQSTP